MSEAEKSPSATVKPEKSKWLSSLVWIVVLWLFVRLIAEMDGISWKRAFWSISVSFGALPATFFLLLATGFARFDFSFFFRWVALSMVIGSFVGGFAIYGIFKKGEETDSVIMLFQLIVSIFVVLGVAARNWWVNKNEASNV